MVRFAAGLGGLGTCLLAVWPAAAQTETVAPPMGKPTTVVTVSGAAFGAHEAVDVYFDTTDTVLLSASASGAFSGTLSIPATAQPGSHSITAVGRHTSNSAQVTFTVATPWLDFGFGAANYGVNGYENTIGTGNAASMGSLWASTASSTGGTPVVFNGRVFVPLTSGGIEALYTAGGAVAWTSVPGDMFVTGASVNAGTVYAASGTGVVYALKSSTGAIIWQKTVCAGQAMYATPLVANGIVYAACYGNDTMYALNAGTGAMVWSFVAGGAVDSSPVAANGLVYFGGRDSFFYALNAATGVPAWKYATAGSVESTPSVVGRTVYFGDEDEHFYALRSFAAEESVLWNVSLNGAVVGSSAVANGMVYVGTTLSTLYGLNAQTGAVVWSASPAIGVLKGVSAANGVVYANGDSGDLYAADAATGRLLWRGTTGAELLGGPSVSDGVVYVSPDGGPVLAFAPRAGMNAVIARSRHPLPGSLHPDMTLVAR